jgi:hypothetical protein
LWISTVVTWSLRTSQCQVLRAIEQSFWRDQQIILATSITIHKKPSLHLNGFFKKKSGLTMFFL